MVLHALARRETEIERTTMRGRDGSRAARDPTPTNRWMARSPPTDAAGPVGSIRESCPARKIGGSSRGRRPPEQADWAPPTDGGESLRSRAIAWKLDRPVRRSFRLTPATRRTRAQPRATKTLPRALVELSGTINDGGTDRRLIIVSYCK